MNAEQLDALADYLHERELMRMCYDCIRLHRRAEHKPYHISMEAHWIKVMLEHRANARRIRLTGNICPF